MQTTIDELTIPTLRSQVRLNAFNYVGEDLILVMDNHELGRTWFRIGQPYRPAEGIWIRVMEGLAIYTVNLTRYELHPGDILVFPENSIFVIEWVTEDLHLQFMTFRDLDLVHPVRDCLRYTLSGNDSLRIGHYVSLMWQVVNTDGFSRDAVKHLQSALLEDLATLGAPGTALPQPTRQEEVFDRFISLLNEHGGTQRNVPFYADRLCLTPNRLSTIVKQVSGQTVMQWINRTAVLHAKLLLKHSGLMMYEIADALQFSNASFFSKFFKRETGMTPAQYRAS